MTNMTGQPESLLDGLFSSHVRVKLLTIFMGQQEARYHGRELAKQTGEHFNAVWQELKHLEGLGLLQAEKAGNQVQYTPNPAFPLFAELRALILKATGTLPPSAPATKDEARKEERQAAAVARPHAVRPFVIGEVD